MHLIFMILLLRVNLIVILEEKTRKTWARFAMIRGSLPAYPILNTLLGDLKV